MSKESGTSAHFQPDSMLSSPDGRLDVAQLVKQFHVALYRYAYRLTGNHADAEDLTQQTFLSAQDKLYQLREPAKVRGWLFSVLRNHFLRAKRKKTPIPAGNIDLDIEEVPLEPPTTEILDQQMLQQALDDLPEEFRIVLMLFYFEGTSYKQIARELDLPMGTVMSRLSRAKGHLRRRLLIDEKALRHQDSSYQTDAGTGPRVRKRNKSGFRLTT